MINESTRFGGKQAKLLDKTPSKLIRGYTYTLRAPNYYEAPLHASCANFVFSWEWAIVLKGERVHGRRPSQGVG